MTVARKTFLIVLAVSLVVFAVTTFFPQLFVSSFGLSFLFFHTMAEMLTITVALAVGSYALWHYSKAAGIGSLVLSITFLTSGILDLIHVLSFPGMPETIIFPSVNTTLWFWLMARLLVAIGLLVALFVHQRSTQRVRLFLWLGLALFIVIIVTSFVAWEQFGTHLTIFAEIFGLTLAKKVIEYIIMAIMAFVGLLYWKRRHTTSANKAYFLLTFVILTIFSELYFTLYPTVYHIQVLWGHLFKIAAYIILPFALWTEFVQRKISSR